MTARDLHSLAADLANEHGVVALDYARRAVATFEAEGAFDRAYFWLTLSAFLDDIFSCRLARDTTITIH